MLPRKKSWRGRANDAHANHTRQTRPCQHSGTDGTMLPGTYTTRVSPAASPVFHGLGGLPFPSPFKADRRTAAGRVVSDEGDVVIFVKVWVSKKLASYEIFDFA